jgi:hypothetical protein
MYSSRSAAASSATSSPTPPVAAHKSFRTSHASHGNETQSCAQVRSSPASAPKSQTAPPTARSPGSCLPNHAAQTFHRSSASAAPPCTAQSSRALSLARTDTARKRQRSALRRLPATRDIQSIMRQSMRSSRLGLGSLLPPATRCVTAGRLPVQRYRQARTVPIRTSLSC